jgi:type III secretion system FlhB-like substrate exporter
MEALQREVVAHDNERLAANLVCHDLGVPQPPEMSSLVARITLILDRVRELERSAFQAGIHRLFALAH